MNNRKYFFCYNSRCYLFLKEKGFKHITKAKTLDTNDVFCLYERTPQLEQAIAEYRALKDLR